MTELDDAMARHGVPGVSIAVLRAGEIVEQRVLGVLAHAEPGPVVPDTLFQACSISKLATVLGLLRLVDDGRLDLDADVNDVLTGWQVPPNGSWQPRVTLRQLASHSAGLSTSGLPGYRVGAPLPSTVDVLRGAPPTNTPGVRVELVPGVQFRYSGGGITVLQLVLEELTGAPAAEALRDLVLEPLGMVDSTFAQPLPEALHARAAAAHQPGPRVVPGRWHVYPETCAAGLWTTPTDLCRLAVGVQRAAVGAPGALVAPATAADMLTAQSPPSAAAGRIGGLNAVGLGAFVRVDDGHPGWFGHSGGNEGFSCLLLAHRDGRGAAVMTNSDVGISAVVPAFREIAAAEGWADYPDLDHDGPPHGSDLDAFAGSYQMPDGGPVTVTRDGDRLDLVVGEGTALGCWPYDADTAGTFLADVRIARDDDGIVLHQGGVETRCRRVDLQAT